ncbi:hypothetical protein WCT82_00110 [Pectobacterium carotovorum]|uniref:hypothetical protein n=1 Tax=Pectobacterium carotovorum TaxID=554 RepID=UPI000AE6902D|nr:hypothetical protein [Pectobacterium carotovorum]MBA0191489.1 hypothetical protein [Pectobacterium carotovorum]MBL0908364.1 hypothetical protein [Pectobacterium carotovorum]MCA6975497.1 hypothetical protein [Pectobacterium carotovorum]
MIDAIKLPASVAIIERGKGMSDFYAKRHVGREIQVIRHTGIRKKYGIKIQKMERL